MIFKNTVWFSSSLVVERISNSVIELRALKGLFFSVYMITCRWPAFPLPPLRSFCESMTTGQGSLFHWSYVHKNTSTFWHFGLCRYNLYCSWDPLSLEAKLRKRRDRKKEGNFTGCADLEVVTILFWRFPPLSLFLVWRKLSVWELAILFLLRLSSTPSPPYFTMLWFNFKSGWVGEVEEKGSFCKVY